MDNIAGTKSSLTWAVHLSVLALVLLWIFPTLGLFVSSFRTADQISTSGWWNSMFPAVQTIQLRTGGADVAVLLDGVYVVDGNLLTDAGGPGPASVISHFGTSSQDVSAYEAGALAEFGKGDTLTVAPDGAYTYTSPEEPGSRGQRVFVTAETPPVFTTNNYYNMLFKPGNTDGMGRAFLSTLTVTIPSTIIPILVAAFAAYALAWMEFPGRSLLIAAIVGLLVVPLQLALIPLLKFHNEVGIGKGYMGVWFAHTGFGLPLAIYLLRNYMVGLPRDIIENARVDGATDFQIFTKIILPLSFPALASFAIFQFLWTWNDLLVAKVFLIDPTQGTTVMTDQIVQLMGSRGGNWEILATAAFISIAVPLIVFFAMQKYLVRGLLAGSVK